MLNTKEVKNVFLKCLFEKHEVTEGEIPVNAVPVDAIRGTFYFHGGRLTDNRDKIAAFISYLPNEFQKGASFLELCMTREGHLWGEHKNCEQLMTLGVAVGILEYPLPRVLWETLPGGMPYVKIKEEK